MYCPIQAQCNTVHILTFVCVGSTYAREMDICHQCYTKQEIVGLYYRFGRMNASQYRDERLSILQMTDGEIFYELRFWTRQQRRIFFTSHCLIWVPSDFSVF